MRHVFQFKKPSEIIEKFDDNLNVGMYADDTKFYSVIKKFDDDLKLQSGVHVSHFTLWS